jgi:F-type H+-transporting ATPase subunit b
LCVLLLLAATSPFAVRRVHAAPAAPRATQEAAAAHESGTGEAEAAGGWSSTIAKAFNFAALAALLVYFLRTPIASYLRERDETIRKDLTEAAALRGTAEQQLADVRQRLTTLPAEVDALRRRGQDELAQERARLADATTRERDQVIDRTRREVDLRFRVARRDLLEHVAELSMQLARTRIEREITPDDQQRLIERYATEVRA